MTTNVEEIKNDSHYREVLDQGFVGLVDYMGDDSSIVQAARVSYGKGTKKVSEDRGLIRYLIRHSHSTPLEMVSFKFHAKMPIFVARQWVRHRTASINEYSGRYSVMSDEFYVPTENNIQPQSTTNNQGREGAMSEDEADTIIDMIEYNHQETYSHYKKLLEKNLARELSRIVLPLSNYTEWYWQINLHNLFHFLKLRMDEHAQYEIREYANAMYELIKPIVPVACEAFEDYILKGVNFSKQELDIINHIIKEFYYETAQYEDSDFTIKKWIDEICINTLTKREKNEFLNKLNIEKEEN